MLPFVRPGVRLVALFALLVSVVGTNAAAAAPAPAQAFPSPLRFVSYLDLECFPTEPYQPPDTVVVTRHLNPVLADLPREETRLGEREELCVPVAKDDVFPPEDVLPFIEYVDLSCYRIEGKAVDFRLKLDHLNPRLAQFPTREVAILHPVQLCVPVMKNGVKPPDEVRRLVSFIDLKCYVERPPESLDVQLTLTHLNPVLLELGMQQDKVIVTENRQLCVPVQKNDQRIPDEVLRIVQWIDLEKFEVRAERLPEPITLEIDHLNPEFAEFPTEKVTLIGARHLLLPVAKNGEFPPEG
ncbi:MAG TPA: hypothetical protein VIL37_19645 [Natronosporangium sp.]